MATNFRSDNVTGASPEILAALAAANTAGPATPYGDDPWTARVEARLRELFERDVAAFPVGTGTAANALAMAAIVPPYGAIYCHPRSHLYEDECGAPEHFTGGAKLVPIDGADGRFTAEALERRLADGWSGSVHHPQPAAASITQLSEAGTTYALDDIRAIAAVAHAHGLALHMDGTRLANAIVSLGCTPAEATWRAGVDVLCFGATKNGAFAAEVVVFFDKGLVRDFAFRRKRAGQLFSKMRFISVQLAAYLEDDLWRRNAANANRMARRLAEGLARLPGVRLLHPVGGNEVFVAMPEPLVDALERDGHVVMRWNGADGPRQRLVAAFDTRAEAVDAFLASARRHACTTAAERAE